MQHVLHMHGSLDSSLCPRLANQSTLAQSVLLWHKLQDLSTKSDWQYSSTLWILSNLQQQVSYIVSQSLHVHSFHGKLFGDCFARVCLNWDSRCRLTAYLVHDSRSLVVCLHGEHSRCIASNQGYRHAFLKIHQ
jgi:hypothetical protein